MAFSYRRFSVSDNVFSDFNQKKCMNVKIAILNFRTTGLSDVEIPGQTPLCCNLISIFILLKWRHVPTLNTMVSDLRLEEIAHGFEFIKEKYNSLLFKDKAFSQIYELIDSKKNKRHSAYVGVVIKRWNPWLLGFICYFCKMPTYIILKLSPYNCISIVCACSKPRLKMFKQSIYYKIDI